MSELPRGWASTRVEDIFESHGGGTPSRSNPDYWNGNIPWLSSGDIKSAVITSATESITKLAIDNSSARMCRPGAILVVVRSGILKHTLPIAILAAEAAINQDIKAYDCGNDDLNRWLSISWQASSRELLAENREGTTVQSVKADTLNGFLLPVPPLAEQRRIIAKLEVLLGKVDDCRKRLDKIPVLLKRFRQSVLAAACSGRLTADWREANPADSVSQGIEGPFDVPDSWKWETFEDAGQEITVGYVGPMAKEYVASGIPFLRSLNVRRFRFDESNLKFITPKFHALIIKSRLRPGDVAIVRSGNSGVCCVVPATLPEANCSDLVILRPGKRLVSEYACIFLNSTSAQTHIDSVKVGIAQGHFNVGSMKKTLLPLPPLSEQHEIVRRVEALFAVADQIEGRYGKAKGYVDRLTQSILAKAFRGGLVPQDPSDEPASVLLERIRAKRASAGANLTTRNTRSAFNAPSTLELATPPARRGRPLKAAPPPPDLPNSKGENEEIPLSKPARKILKRMKPGRDYARADLADAIGLSVGEWNAGIIELKGAGLVVQYGARRGTKYRMQCT